MVRPAFSEMTAMHAPLPTAAAIVDSMGDLRAQIAEMTAQYDAYKAHLVGMGAGAYDGERYRATVSESERETLDMVAVREKLSAQFIRAHTNVTPVTTVRVVARKLRAA